MGEDWIRYGACASAGALSGVFFSDEPEDIRAAKAVCASCTVKGQCLDYALRNHEPAGVWGGMTLKERNRYARTVRNTSLIEPNVVPIHRVAQRIATGPRHLTPSERVARG